MIIFEQKWHTSRKEFYRYSGKYVLPVFTGILVKKCATLPEIKSMGMKMFGKARQAILSMGIEDQLKKSKFLGRLPLHCLPFDFL